MGGTYRDDVDGAEEECLHRMLPHTDGVALGTVARQGAPPFPSEVVLEALGIQGILDRRPLP